MCVKSLYGEFKTHVNWRGRQGEYLKEKRGKRERLVMGCVFRSKLLSKYCLLNRTHSRACMNSGKLEKTTGLFLRI